MPDASTGWFSHWWPLLGARKSVAKKLKANFIEKITVVAGLLVEM